MGIKPKQYLIHLLYTTSLSHCINAHNVIRYMQSHFVDLRNAREMMHVIST